MARKWIRNGKWVRMPHAETRPASLWWYRCNIRPPFDDTPTDDSLAVIDLYLHQCARGRTLPDAFRKHLLGWLQDLNRPVKISPRRERYWTIPAYELAHRINPKTLCKRMRELEKIATSLFPDRAPAFKPRSTASEEEKQEIRKLYNRDVPVRDIAEKFKVTPACVGRICRDLKLAKRTAHDENEPVPNQVPTLVSDEEPF
jgi:transposase-like protein